jgi:hypothetical protein
MAATERNISPKEKNLKFRNECSSSGIIRNNTNLTDWLMVGGMKSYDFFNITDNITIELVCNQVKREVAKNIQYIERGQSAQRRT